MLVWTNTTGDAFDHSGNDWTLFRHIWKLDLMKLRAMNKNHKVFIKYYELRIAIKNLINIYEYAFWSLGEFL